MIGTDDADDDLVIAKIKKLDQDNSVEYESVKELCEMHGERNVDGLSVALVQAGAYSTLLCSGIDWHLC